MLFWTFTLLAVAVVAQEHSIIELLTNPTVLAMIGVTGGLSGLVGWVMKGVVHGAKAEAATELEIAIQALERAKLTPDQKDDIEAQKHVDWIKRVKALADALPDPEPTERH